MKKLISTCAILMGASAMLAGCATSGSTDSTESESADVTTAISTDIAIEDYGVDAEITDVNYDASKGVITATVTNNSDSRLDQVAIGGTINIAKQDSSGNPIDDPVDIYQYFANADISYATELLAIDISAHSSKTVTLSLIDTQYQRNMAAPSLKLYAPVLREAGDYIEYDKSYYAEESEYTVGELSLDSSDQYKVTASITNNSTYKWKNVIVSYSYTNDTGETKYSYADGSNVDMGETITLEHILSESATNLKVEHVRFEAGE